MPPNMGWWHDKDQRCYFCNEILRIRNDFTECGAARSQSTNIHQIFQGLEYFKSMSSQIMSQQFSDSPKVYLTKVPSWWFQPIWKILVKMGSSSPRFGLKIKNIWNHHLGEIGIFCGVESNFSSFPQLMGFLHVFDAQRWVSALPNFPHVYSPAIILIFGLSMAA